MLNIIIPSFKLSNNSYIMKTLVNFLVVDVQPPYNANRKMSITKLPRNDLKAKFPKPIGVSIFKEDQQLARSLYLETLTTN